MQLESQILDFVIGVILTGIGKEGLGRETSHKNKLTHGLGIEEVTELVELPVVHVEAGEHGLDCDDVLLPETHDLAH